MANLYYLNDEGEAIVEGGVAYVRIGQVQGQPNDSEPDISNFSETTYTYADANGKSIYTAQEEAVAFGVYGLNASGSSGTPGTVMAEFIAPCAGIIRPWGQFQIAAFYLNGSFQYNFGGSNESKLNATPYSLFTGDVAQVRSIFSYGPTGWGYTFLPFVYPVV